MDRALSPVRASCTSLMGKRCTAPQPTRGYKIDKVRRDSARHATATMGKSDVRSSDLGTVCARRKVTRTHMARETPHAVLSPVLLLNASTAFLSSEKARMSTQMRSDGQQIPEMYYGPWVEITRLSYFLTAEPWNEQIPAFAAELILALSRRTIKHP